MRIIRPWTWIQISLFALLCAPYANATSDFFQSGIEGSFPGAKKISIRYRKWERPDERGAIVFFPGRGDPYEIYDETLKDLYDSGYSIYAMDHRGQGASDHFLADRQLDHIDKFDRFVDDAKTFLTEVVNARPHAKRYLIAHSMGGAISARYLEKYPSDFNAATLVAPMFRINTQPYSFFEGIILARILLIAGRGEHYAPNRGPFNPDDVFRVDNKLTSSEPRWTAMQETLKANREIQIGGPTVHWVQESINAGFKIQSDARKVRTPILILSAENDQVVENDQETAFCNKAPGCALVVLPEARHMILNEVDSIRTPALQRISGFFGQY